LVTILVNALLFKIFLKQEGTEKHFASAHA
jgi:hypothetical protein